MTLYKKVVVALLALALLGGATLYFWPKEAPTPTLSPTAPEREVVGYSFEGRAIESFTFGSGTTNILIVGGIHGGYEWNSTLLAYELMDYFEENPQSIPESLSLTIIPVANPDGLALVTGKSGRFAISDVKEPSTLGEGRFNARGVDLNRNFDCKWKPKSTWRGTEVSAGSSAFSEPEAQAVRKVVDTRRPTVALFLHSQANAIYASECEAGILPLTHTLMHTYATAAGYPAVDVFDAYEISGDAEGWLASINVPALTIELSSHTSLDWEKNLAGMRALMLYLVNR